MPPKERRLKPFLLNKASLRWLYQPTQVDFVSQEWLQPSSMRWHFSNTLGWA